MCRGSVVVCNQPELCERQARLSADWLGANRRIYFLQQWYGLSDEGLEDTLYDSIALYAFVGIDLVVENVPDATTLLKFQRLLIERDLTRKLFDEIGISLCKRGQQKGASLSIP